MNQSIRYVALYENDTVSGLGRIMENGGMWGESLVGGKWVRDDVVLDALFSPGFAEIVSDDEAKTIAIKLGVDLETSQFH